MEIRYATLSDLPEITDIYNEAIRTTAATFDTVEKTVEEQAVWFNQHGLRHPIFVAVEAEQILGWACLSKWSERYGYVDTAEDSVYVRNDARGKGIGKELLKRLMDEAERLGFHSILARISADNAVSVHIHAQVGFQHAGLLHEIGQKFGKFHDVYIMQKIISEPKAGK